MSLEDSWRDLKATVPKKYTGAKPAWFYLTSSALIVSYVTLAVLGVETPHGLDIVAGALVGGQYARTFQPGKD